MTGAPAGVRLDGRVKPGHDILRYCFAALFVFCLGVFSLPAGAEPQFPPLTGRIVDDAHLLTAADRASIEADLKALEEKSSDQLVVYTTNSLQGYPIEDFGYRLGRAWGIGQKGTNNGVLLIVAPAERKVRIEVGRGLEPQLTDALSKLIVQNAILPRFKRGEFSAGIKAGVHDIRDAMLGDVEAVKERVAARPMKKRNANDNEALLTLIVIVAIFLFVLWAQSQQGGPASRYGRRASYGGGPVFFPGGWGGGGGGGSRDGGGGGGWSGGGGGDFGGGGASGDW
jgi:uncharacterized protein